MRPNLALTRFYEVFADDEVAPRATRLQLLKEWNSSVPSVTARVAFAFALYRAAWTARGSGFQDTVTATAGASYDKWIAQGIDVVAATKRDAEVDPQYWFLRIALAGETGREDVRELGLRALGLHPDAELARHAARYLSPLWGGTPESYMAFADAAARATREHYGDAIYMWLVYQIKNSDSSEDYKMYNADWSRVRKGAEDLIRVAPEWLPSYHRFALLARRYDDPATAHKLFQLPQLAWYRDADRMWGSREFYDGVREWALSYVVAPGPR